MAYTFDSILDNLFNDILTDMTRIPTGPYYYYETFSNDEKDVVNSSVVSDLPYNLSTTEKGLELSIAMAGVKKENIDLEVSGRIVTITVKGETITDEKVVLLHKGLKVPSNKDNTVIAKIHEKFDCNKIEAFYENGLFTIKIPLKDEEKSRKIKF